MEPISILSIIVQLATSAPELNKLITTEKTVPYSRTETIEIYRTIMKPLIKIESNNSTQR